MEEAFSQIQPGDLMARPGFIRQATSFLSSLFPYCTVARADWARQLRERSHKKTVSVCHLNAKILVVRSVTVMVLFENSNSRWCHSRPQNTDAQTIALAVKLAIG